MSLGKVERVDNESTLDEGIGAAFDRLGSSGATRCAIVFDVRWQPTMDVVDLVARRLDEAAQIEVLTLVHPSAAMGFIASALGLRVSRVQVHARGSVHAEPVEDENADLTASRTMFVMQPGERLESFVRSSVRSAGERVLRRFALLFDARAPVSMELADLLVEELMESGVRELGLVHPTQPLDTVVAALRLRLPAVRVQCSDRSAAIGV